MKTLNDLFKNIRRLDLKKLEIQDSLYRIGDWLSDEDHNENDKYVQDQLKYLNKFVEKAKRKNNYYITSKGD